MLKINDPVIKWLYLQYPLIGGCCTFIRIHYCKVSLLGLRIYIYIYIYIYINMYWETMYSCNPLVVCFRREMNMSWRSYFLFILFHLTYGNDILSSCITFMIYRKWPQSRKLLLYYVVLKRNNCVVKNIFIACLLLLREWTRPE